MLLLDCVIVNGFCNSDANGEFTYVSPHGSSVIDYFIISEDLFPDHCELRIGDRVDSWHLPVEFKWKQAGRMTDQPEKVMKAALCGLKIVYPVISRN